MDDEWEEQYGEYEVITQPVRRLQLIDIAVLGMQFARDVAVDFGNTLGTATTLIAAHANYKTRQSEQRDFRIAALTEIDTMTGEQDG